MITTGYKPIIDRLLDMMRDCPEIVEATFTSSDGRTTGSVLMGDIEEEKILVMSSALISVSTRITQELDHGTLSYIHIKGESGDMVITLLEGAALIVQANKRAKIGLVISEMNKAAKELVRLALPRASDIGGY